MSHYDSTRADRKSQAPYNFVRLPKEVFLPDQTQVAHDRYDAGRYTGYFNLNIKAETDLYVRCAPKLEEVEQEPAGEKDSDLTRSQPHRQDFFHHGDKNTPVIPGSSIRGPIRLLVEIMGHGRMQRPSEERSVYRAIEFDTDGGISSLGSYYREQMMKPRGRYSPDGERPRPRFEYPTHNIHGGYLEKRSGGWYIRPAVTDQYGQSFVLTNAQPIQRLFTDLGNNPDPNDYPKGIDGYVRPVSRVVGQPHSIGQNGRPRIYLDIAYPAPFTVTPPDASYLPGTLVVPGSMPEANNRHMYAVIYSGNEDDDSLIPICDDVKNAYIADRDLPRGGGREPRKLQETGQPLFYRLDNEDRVDFFGPTMLFRLRHTRSPRDFISENLRIVSGSAYDLPEMIFGTVRPGEAASGSENASFKGRVSFLDAEWVQGNYPFYTEYNGRKSPRILSGPKPTAFQHYLDQTHPDSKESLVHWSSDSSGARIRGYKGYWHRKAVDAYERQLENGKQHTIIRPVKVDTEFKGKVIFENLTCLELGALIAALELPENMRHKLGMGKPYGMGSVKVDVELVLEDRQKRYATHFENGRFANDITPSEETARIKQEASNAFTKKMIEHHQRSGGLDQHPRGGIWRIPRLGRDLASLLEWDEAPNKSETDYLPLGNAWKNRPVLPHPRAVKDGIREERR